MKSKLRYTSHVPDWAFVFSGFGKFTWSDSRVNVWNLTDLVPYENLNVSYWQTVKFPEYTLRNCFFWKKKKKLNVIHQFKDDKFTDWILEIRKRILRATSLCTHCNITKSEANIELVEIRILFYKVEKNRVYFTWIYFLYIFFFF